MHEIDALGESNYQLLALGRNLSQIARCLNEGYYEPVTIEQIEALSRSISKHTDVVSSAMLVWRDGALPMRLDIGYTQIVQHPPF